MAPSPPAQVSLGATIPTSIASANPLPLSYADVLMSTLSAGVHSQGKANDRKYNFVLYGINESPEGTRSMTVTLMTINP